MTIPVHRFIFILLIFLSIPSTSTAQTVNIPDPNLRAAIAAELGKASSDPITTSDMAALRSLTARESNISDLTGLKHAINLTSLDLGDNSISDITSLSGLTNLRSLYLLGNSISNITSLSGLINLTVLYLGHNLISDISTVSGLTNLRTLHLGYNSISDIASLSGLINLTLLYLQGNLISDISAISDLTNLRRLGISNNNISDISAVSGLTDLAHLYLLDNSVSDISAVSGLTNLTHLSLTNNSVSDISAVSGLTNLTSLSLPDNSVSDISVVSGLTNLRALHLQDNSVSDISVVSGLINLTHLNLTNNSVSDISPLVENTGLAGSDEAHIRGNPLSYLSIHTHIPTLQSRGVTVVFDGQAHRALLKVSGDNQEGMPKETLARLLVIEAQDTDGSALVGIWVTFTVVTGGGTLSTTNTMTDGNGRAQSLLTLGPNPGTQIVSVSATGIEAPATFHAISEIHIEYLLSLPTGISLIHVPLKVTAVDGAEQTIESIADLYDVLGGASSVNFLITYDSQTQEWLSYFVPSDKGTPANRGLTADMGIIAGLRAPVSVQTQGRCARDRWEQCHRLEPRTQPCGALPLNRFKNQPV